MRELTIDRHGSSRKDTVPVASAGRVLNRTPRLLAGLVIMGFALSLQVEAHVGLSPWTVFHQGLSKVTPLTIGAAGIVTGLVLLLAWIPLKQRIGLGTLGNVVLIGVSLDVALLIVPTPNGLLLRWTFLAVGVLLMGFGTGLYIGTRLGPGPRDGIMTGLAEQGRVSIRSARTLLEACALLVGWLLGGNVGAGTVFTVLSIGPVVQFFLERLDLGPIGEVI